MTATLPDVTYRSPSGITYEDQDDDIVKVNVVLLGLKKKLLKNEPSNATIEVKFQERSLHVHLWMKAPNKEINQYRYEVKKLVDDIDSDKSYYKIKENQVILYLKKATPRSWARELSEGGLDLYEDPEPQE